MSRLVRLIGSEWSGSRIPAPKRKIPEHGVKLKLKGRNFRVIEEDGELVAYFLGELSDDIVEGEIAETPGYPELGMRRRRRYDECSSCNFDQHTCPGCGEPLSHDGIHLGKGPLRGFPHGSSCVDD